MNSSTGAERAVIEGARCAIRAGQAATLALVVETEGSTYVRRGAIALFAAAGSQVGWLSGGCLEPEIAARAESVAATGTVAWMEIDTRDDEDLFVGSATGCRGQLRLVLLPLLALPGWDSLADAWTRGAGPLAFDLEAPGRIECRIGSESHAWGLGGAAPDWTGADPCASAWHVEVPAPPAVLMFGAGPETPLLIPLLRSLGWITHVVEHRPRWRSNAELADRRSFEHPETALDGIDSRSICAALVMHHNFELDRIALEALAFASLPYIGLLGPLRRRQDLFSLLPEPVREALLPRLHSPVGLDLGGSGPEAIALSIAAQLHASRHRA